MHLVLANPRGFCAGVRMAIDVVQQVSDLCPDQTIYVYHEIVHNKHVVDRFVAQNVAFVEDIDDVPVGSIVVFSAHGIPPQTRQRAADRDLFAIDATCPLVTKVHSEAIRYDRQGYEILLVGHQNHQEVIGTSGEAPDAIHIIETPEDVWTVQVKDSNHVAVLTQTTLSTDDADVIISEIKKRFPNVKEPPSGDICYATTNRQEAVREIAPSCDLTLVVGSTNSSNSVRLTEISRNVGCDAHLLDDVTQLKDEWFSDAPDRVLITAGASAPEDLVAGICRELVERYGATIEQHTLTEEAIEFGLPVRLKRLMAERGVEGSNRRVRVHTPTITQEAYGAVPLTIDGLSPHKPDTMPKDTPSA